MCEQIKKSERPPTFCIALFILASALALRAQETKGLQCATATDPTYQYLDAHHEGIRSQLPNHYEGSHAMPPRITRNSDRPRASNRTMVDTQIPSSLAKF